MVRVACIAADISYEHASSLVRVHGETGWTARLVLLTVDGLISPVRWRRLTQRGGEVLAFGSRRPQRGSFSFEVCPPTNEVEYRATHVVTVTDASGNVASGIIEIDSNTANRGPHTWTRLYEHLPLR